MIHNFSHCLYGTNFKIMRRKKPDTLRFQLGINQDLMALWLGTSRSLYSMYEARQRNLPGQANLKQTQIEQAWNLFQEEWKPQPELAEPPSEDELFKIQVLTHKLKQARYALKKLEVQPDFQKSTAFFKKLLSNTEDKTEQVIFQIQLFQLQKEKSRVNKEKKRLSAEVELLDKQLEILNRGIVP